MERIFDPGFTTKGVGVGTGLGLSISKKIVEQGHGGRITVSNHPHGGAIFRLEIPLSNGATIKSASRPAAGGQLVASAR
jgi:two-component system C4-dicarboxylate transport sensor histidine kinase DctB